MAESDLGRASLALMAATVVAMGLVAAVWGAGEAEAAFPGENGKIAFTSERTGNNEVYVMDPDGQNQTRLTNNAVIDDQPAFSPDGTKIAFKSQRDGNNEVYVMDPDGQNQTRLTNNAAGDAQPSFSPDGTKIAFTSGRDGAGGGFGEIYVMDSDGQNQIRLTNNTAFDANPAFSPDGTKIAFESGRDDNSEVYVMNALDGTDQTNLSDNTAFDGEPAFSPDGTKIAFMSFRDGNNEIYVMNALDGSGQSNITNILGDDAQPTFSPDGTRIAFRSGRTGDVEVHAMDSDGQNPTNLTNDEDGNDSEPDWGPLSKGPLSNDSFSFPQSLSGSRISVNDTNVGATRESGEPDHLDNPASLGENSVWFAWTAPASGRVNVDTCTSSFDTALAVYTGGSIGSLSQVASDDDSCDAPNNAGSTLTFDAVAGTTYRIAVAGYFASSKGTFTLGLLDVEPPKVTKAVPREDATQVGRATNVSAFFSEPMQAGSVTTASFRLFKVGSATPIGATVTYDAAKRRAILNPNANLLRGTKYKAEVTSGARDLADNGLDQDPSAAGNQKKVWLFKTGN